MLGVVREYHKRGIPLDVIVLDFFHWFAQVDLSFYPIYWPDAGRMIHELHDMGTELMVSVWPTIDTQSKHYQEMQERGLLVKAECGLQVTMDFVAPTVFFDVTNPEARAFAWEKVKEGYYQKGIRIIRTMFMEYRQDEQCWRLESQYMFGGDVLVALVLEKDMTQREV